ncbi:MAG TPA: hypothetical protein VFD84_16420 [Candidatus Binatia bacterium]|nr:hypothetical protein [Candidatus Binatia bacterium]
MLSTAPGRDKVTTRRTPARLALLVMVLGLACRPDASTPRGTAERFLDAHYVRIDLPAALPFTSGLARHKVEEELRLVQGQEIDETTRKPMVRYALLEEHPDGDAVVRFVYRGTILVEDADRLERRWMVTVRREGADWRVTNYEELGE